MEEHGIEFFHPGLGSIRCILCSRGSDAGQPMRLVGASLEAGGDVLLQVAPESGGAEPSLAPLTGVHEQPDGGLQLQLADGSTLSVPSAHAARARDVVLSLANRITPYF